MTRNEIIKHYKDFFDLHAKGIALDENDHFVIDYAEDLIKTALGKKQQNFSEEEKPLYQQGEGLMYLRNDINQPSHVNEFLTCRDGIVEMIAFNSDSGYGIPHRFFNCYNTKHEVRAYVLQYYRSGELWREDVISSDSDSFREIEKVLGVSKDEDNDVVLYRTYGN